MDTFLETLGIIEVSPDLHNWYHKEGLDIHTQADTGQSMTVRDAVPLDGNASRFIRLRVEGP